MDGAAWAQRLKNKVLEAIDWWLIEITLVVMRLVPTARILCWFLRRPFVVWVLTPVLRERVLVGFLRRSQSPAAVTTWLRLRGSESASIELLARHHRNLATAVCDEAARPRILALVGRPGLGRFLRNFYVAARPAEVVRFLRHPSTHVAAAAIIGKTSGKDAAGLVASDCEGFVKACAAICTEEGFAQWAIEFVQRPDIDEWIGAFITDRRALQFVSELLRSPGFDDFLEDFVSGDTLKFVASLLAQPRCDRFVAELNKPMVMREWFASWVSRPRVMVFMTKLMRVPGTEKLIVRMMCMEGNDMALRTMLEYWVRKDASLGQVVDSFAAQPRAEEALARVLLSPGFFNRFVFGRLLWQPGLDKVFWEATEIVGFKVFREKVLPLWAATLSYIFLIQVVQSRESFDIDGLADILENVEIDSIVQALAPFFIFAG